MPARPMSRTAERLIDVLVLTELLVFSYLLRDAQPTLAGVVLAAAVQFWMSKNALQARSPNDE